MTTQWLDTIIIPGVVEVLETIPALVRLNANGVNVAVQTSWPTSVTTSPMVSVLYDGHEMTQSGQVFMIDYSLLLRLWVQWQDFAGAETTLRGLVDTIANTITGNPSLRGRLPGLSWSGASTPDATLRGGTGMRIDPGQKIARGFVGASSDTKLIVDFPVRVQIKVATTTLRPL